MDFNRACSLFDITDISLETEDTVKSKYRQLTKKYHPDNVKTGDQKKFLEIRDAIEILTDAIKKISQYKEINRTQTLYTMVITLDKLIHLYQGGTITMGDGENSIEVNKGIMKKNNTLILSAVSIEHNGTTYNYDNVEAWNIDDKYNVCCDLFVENIVDAEDIKIKIHDKELNISMKSQSMSINFILDYNIKIRVTINKKIRVDNKT